MSDWATPNQSTADLAAAHDDVANRVLAGLDHADVAIQSAAETSNLADAFAPVLDCLHQVLTAPRRREAIEELARRIAFECPGATVRIAIGRNRIARFFDSRLGWLPRGNSVRDAAEAQFIESAKQRDLADQFSISSVRRDASDPGGEDSIKYECIDLTPDGNDDARRSCIVLMIRPQTGNDQFQTAPAWLHAHAGTLATAIGSRAQHRLPRWVDFISARPMITIAFAAMVIAGIGMWPTPYPVACTAEVTPTAMQILAAPFDATLLSAAVAPGDRVTAGQPLLQLDGRPLQIELDSLQAEISAAEKDASIALAGGKIALSQRANLERNKLLHRSKLIRSRLDQLVMTAPADGIIIGGDLRRHVGSPLNTGQTLLEVAPEGSVEIEIEIPEFEVNQISERSATRIRFAAVGGPSIDGEIESVDPRAEIREDASVFVARVPMAAADPALRVGMRGNATVYGPVRPLAWSYLRPWYERMLWSLGY